MRIKVECGTPLTSLKAWFVVPAVSTVLDLKEALCVDFPALTDEDLATENLVLILDGFELLDASSIDVVRDGDLITVKQRVATSYLASKKRRAEEPVAPAFVKRPKNHRVTERVHASNAHDKLPTHRPIPRTKPPVSKLKSSDHDASPGSDSEGSDSDDDSAASSSDASSDSDSSSSDSDSSGTSSASDTSSPSIQSSKQQAAIAQLKPTAKAESTSNKFIPPGHGKASTKNRNLRRRRKQQYARLAEQGGLDDNALDANSIPLGTRMPVADLGAKPEDSAPGPSGMETPQPTVMMASLSNKNKRKGFKQAMASVLPRKIVFAATNETSPSITADSPTLPFESIPPSEIVLSNLPRLVTPSEKQENGQIPRNIIVTSIDVEEGKFPNRRKQKNKQTVRQTITRSETQEVENVVLDYDGDGDMIPSQREYNVYTTKEPSIIESTAYEDWRNVDKNWDRLTKIKVASQVSPGCLVGWKALAINPATFTPEFFLNVGRVIGCADVLGLQPVHRPGAVEVSFGGPMGEEEKVDPLEAETYEWSDVFTGDWRVVT